MSRLRRWYQRWRPRAERAGGLAPQPLVGQPERRPALAGRVVVSPFEFDVFSALQRRTLAVLEEKDVEAAADRVLVHFTWRLVERVDLPERTLGLRTGWRDEPAGFARSRKCLASGAEDLGSLVRSREVNRPFTLRSFRAGGFGARRADAR